MRPIAESRERITEAAAELFLGGSFHKIGIAEICEVARVNKGTFYHFFSSKLDLLLEVMDGYVADCRSDFASVGLSDDTPERKLLALFSVPRARNEAWKKLHGNAPGCFLGNVILEMGASEPVVRERAEKAIADLTVVIQQVVEEYLSETAGKDQLHEEAGYAAADALMTFIQGAQIQAKARNDPAVFDRYAVLAPSVVRGAAEER